MLTELLQEPHTHPSLGARVQEEAGLNWAEIGDISFGLVCGGMCPLHIQNAQVDPGYRRRT